MRLFIDSDTVDGHGTPQDGTIVRVGPTYVFVRYGHNDTSIRATSADHLTLLADSLRPDNAERNT